MGIMRCQRGICNHILCDRHSTVYGYICDDCFDELVFTGTIDIGFFMGSPAPPSIRPGADYYEELFPILHSDEGVS